MSLERIRCFVEQKRWRHRFTREDGLDSIDFEARGLSYHVWEFDEGEPGAESNVRTAGRQEDYFGDYEEAILEILKTWK